LPFVALVYICNFVRLRNFVWISCLVNFNLRRSCKLGLRRMWCRWEFIAETCLSVAKHGVCSKRPILINIFFWFLAWSFT
jgi:hypothetical protein